MKPTLSLNAYVTVQNFLTYFGSQFPLSPSANS